MSSGRFVRFWKRLRSGFIHSRIGMDRWWLAAILVAIAVWATPMSVTLHWILAGVAWSLALPWLIVCLFWDWFRWHWPFMPIEIQEQIQKGAILLKNATEAEDSTEIERWRVATRGLVQAAWGDRSNQLKAFDGGYDLLRGFSYSPKQANEILIRQELLILKRLDPN